MGEVYRAERDGPAGRVSVALKRVLPRLQGDPGLRGRFAVEARANGFLDHANVVRVLEWSDQPEPYLVMELREGTTAARLLKACAERGQRLPPAAVAHLVAEAATGLDYAHRREDEQRRPLGLVHRDVSPQNLLVGLDGSVRVSDCAVAHAVVGGTPGAVTKLAYAAPELLRGEAADWRADVFALGVVLWELLLVRPLVPRADANAARQALLAGRFDAPSRVDPSVPQAFDGVVLAALAGDPAQRTESAGLLAQQLRAVAQSLAPGFDAAAFVRAAAALAPELAWRAPSRGPDGPVADAAPRPATMPPSRSGPAAPMAMQGLGANPLGAPQPAPLPAPAPPPPALAPAFAPLAPAGAMPPLEVPSSPLASLPLAPPSPPAYDLSMPQGAAGPGRAAVAPAIGPVAPRPPQSAPSNGGLVAAIVVVMVLGAGGLFWWITHRNDASRPLTGPATPVSVAALPDAPPSAPVAVVVDAGAPAPTGPRVDYTPRAVAALNALDPAVTACLRADRGAAEECTATVTFDNANGGAVTSEVAFREARGSTVRAQQCVQAALQRARFTSDPGASGMTRAAKSWRMGRALGGGGGGGSSTIYWPFGTPH